MYSVPSGNSCQKRLPAPLPPFLVEFSSVLYTVLKNLSLNEELYPGSFEDTPNSENRTGMLRYFSASSM
ncbi:hypothetical protein SLEP1_g15374 [Rubroshorea leprosula]|uniref:Uncharacterized protein n=1 Tax=Rubroshorea leprosula TaxID=152421 RepID=A0AAV5IM47_9ROSI|nr:hypothetical protein SLEP1_g15374 [Rubroshorea leprosula]